MGLEVVEIESESFVFTGGRKVVRTLQAPVFRRAAWLDHKTDALRQYRI